MDEILNSDKIHEHDVETTVTDSLTVFDLGQPGRCGPMPPPAEDELPELEECIDPELRRSGPVGLPEISELDGVRHYTRLSTRNFSIDNTFYPLGSCTMKYNPRLNEVAAGMTGILAAHPLAEVEGGLQSAAEVGASVPHVLRGERAQQLGAAVVLVEGGSRLPQLGNA